MPPPEPPVIPPPPPEPKADFVYRLEMPYAPTNVLFTSTPEGIIREYSWHFYDEVGWQYGKEITKLYPNPGQFPVYHRVRDFKGRENGIFKFVEISKKPEFPEKPWWLMLIKAFIAWLREVFRRK